MRRVAGEVRADDPDAYGGRSLKSSPEALAADLRLRLRPVCGHLPEGDFEELVQDIVRTKLRWSRQ